MCDGGGCAGPSEAIKDEVSRARRDVDDPLQQSLRFWRGEGLECGKHAHQMPLRVIIRPALVAPPHGEGHQAAHLAREHLHPRQAGAASRKPDAVVSAQSLEDGLGGVAQSPLTGTFLATTDQLTIGAKDAAVTTETVDGRIDEVAIYGSALSEAQVLGQYQRAHPVETTFPVVGGGYGDASWDAGCAGRICGTISAERGIAAVAVSVRQGSGNYWNGAAFASATEVLLPATGTTTWTLPFPAANFPAEGQYTVRAVATDASGTSFAASTPFTVDRTAPSVSLYTPADAGAYNDAVWNSACTSTVCGLYSDAGAGVATVAVSLRQGAGNYWNGTAFASATEVLVPTTLGPRYWYTAFPGATFLAEGSYTARAVAADVAGNTSTTSATFIIDRTTPIQAITFPTASAYTGLTWDAGCTAGICGTASDSTSAVAGSAVTVRQVSTGNYWDGSSFSSATSVGLTAAGTTSWSVPFPAANFLASGSYAVDAFTADVAGNIAVASTTFTVDRTPPAVAVTVPVASAAYTNATWDAGCTSRICVTANSGATPVASVAVSLRQGTGNYWNGSSFASASEVMIAAIGTASWSLPFVSANFAADGPYTVRAAATSTDGLTRSASATFNIDRTVPTVALTFPTAGGLYGTASWNAGCASTICGTAADTGSGLASVKVSIRQGTGNYWNGTSFASATEVLTTATGTAS